MDGRKLAGWILTGLSAVSFIAAFIAGNVPYTAQGVQWCESYFGSLNGTDVGQAVVDGLSGGACTSYHNTMGFWTNTAFTIGFLALLGGLTLVVVGFSAARKPPAATPPLPTPPPGAQWAAGWYPDWAAPGSERLRWWDGRAWTTHVHDPATPPPPGAGSVG